jgi:hypothetical protein
VVGEPPESQCFFLAFYYDNGYRHVGKLLQGDAGRDVQPVSTAWGPKVFSLGLCFAVLTE